MGHGVGAAHYILGVLVVAVVLLKIHDVYKGRPYGSWRKLFRRDTRTPCDLRSETLSDQS
ncbi:hypothetical protein D3C84_1050680 [compost metagenome]